MFKDLRKIFWQLIIGKGVKLASKDKYEYRLSICRSNACGVYKNPLKLNLFEKCGDCGCFLRTKNKIDEFYIECPKKFW
jgi:hypothetical protein|tara:strand:+ start:354 stop:590 length:237 start_codon:yes stop_codon:yes gene_type:complete